MDDLAYFRRQLNDHSEREALPVGDSHKMSDSVESGEAPGQPGDNMSPNQGDSVEVTLG
jgi:hypothetical protein